MPQNSILVSGRDILVNGKKTQIRSGAMHYFRIHPDYWRDRIVKLRQCGLNTLETYLCWNLHEPCEGCFDFTGWLDFVKYVRIAQEEGLMVILRPGGYICSEWDLGALPSWLLTKPGMHLRCMNEPFLKAQDAYYRRVLELIKPLQFTQDGPVIMMQIENEYGSYGNDHEYIAHCKGLFRDCGIEIPLFTSDGAGNHWLSAGTDPELLPTVNGRNHPAEMIRELDAFRSPTPPVIMELWNGTGLHWGVMRPEHKAEDVRRDIAEAMEHNINFNLYMFHGGTNFGYMGGANGGANPLENPYKPMLTSYDVDAPLNESGEPTGKYFAIQSEIAKHDPGFRPETPRAVMKKAYGKICLTEFATLEDSLNLISKARKAVHAEPMEYYGQNYGFILYRYHLEIPGNVRLHGLKDRALAMVNGETVAVLYRNDRNHSFPVPFPKCRLDILVENMGRINFGYRMDEEFKGIRRLTLDGQEQFHCEVCNLPMDNLEKLRFQPLATTKNVPSFYRGTFEAEELCDTFLRIPAGNKGILWINGFNLGRYWNIGPQKTLYVPAPLLKKGANEVIVFELHGLSENSLESVDTEDFGSRIPMMLP